MSTNVGSISVGMNVDLAQFQAGMSKATDLARSNTALMSAEMRTQSREGAESLRLIDEAIGVHISRPLTRVIAQIPGVGAALQDLFAISATAAIGGVLIEGLERIGKKIEEVREKPLEIAESWNKVSATFDASTASFEKTINSIEAHIVSLTSGKLAALNLELKNLGTTALEAQKGTDSLFTSIEAALKKGQPGFIDNLLGNAGDLLDRFNQKFRPQAAEVDQLNEHFRSLKLYIDQAFQADAINKTHDALTLINKSLEEEQDKLLGIQNLNRVGKSSDEAVASQQAVVGYLVYAASLAQQSSTEDAAERHAKNLDIEKEKLGEVIEELKSYNEAKDALNKKFLADSLLVSDYPPEAEAARRKLNDASFQELNKRSRAADKEFAPYFDNTKDKTLAPAGPPPTSDQEELIKIQLDLNEARRKAAEVLTQIETPTQKYAVAQQTLNVLLKDGLISRRQYDDALAQADQRETLAEEHLRKLNEELIKAASNSTSAAAGVKAFYLQLQIDAAQNGKFAFDFLSQGVKGFEDTFTKSLTLVSRNSREHTIEIRRMWSELFTSLEDQALKFALNKSIAAVLGQVANSSIGKSIGSALGIGGSATGTASLQAAGTTLLTAGTTLVASGATLTAASTTLLSAATALAAGAAGGTGSADFASLFNSLIPHAAGGDVTPGQGYLVGEQGPEPFFPTSGGTILPHSALGGSQQTTYIDARGADASVEQRIHRAMLASEDRAVARSVTMNTEIGKRRPGR